MKILFYDAKPYDREFFDRLLPLFPGISIDYLDTDISSHTARLASGYDAVCLFVASDVGEAVIRKLAECNIKLILMRCAGFNNVSLETARELGVTVMRVPG